MQIDKQLLEITEILNRNNIFYWIDSGTLLGIVREGKLLGSDLDIDISIPVNEQEKVWRLKDEFGKIGYFFTEKWVYKSYDYILKLKNKNNDRPIDFQIYHSNDEQNIWYSPQCFNKKSSNIFSKIIRKLVHQNFLGNSFIKNTGKYSFVYDHITWVESKSLIGTPVYLEHTPLKVPENYIGLLELHFGANWRIPNSNWDFIRDDGAFVRKKPDSFKNHSPKAI